MFTEKFGRFVCDGDTIRCTVDGFDVVATVKHDDTMRAPWKEHDGHGPVSEWTQRDKAPGERVLSEDRRSKRFYDFAEAVKIAKRDGWGVEGGKRDGETDGQYAARAAEHDFKVLRAWCNDEWHWSGVVVTVSRAGVELGAASVWGVERNYPGSDNSYLTETANELLSEAIASARAKIKELTP